MRARSTRRSAASIARSSSSVGGVLVEVGPVHRAMQRVVADELRQQLEARDARLAAAQAERDEAVDASARSRGCGRCSRRAGVPRNPVCGKRAGVAMFATSTTSCIDTSTRCGAPARTARSAPRTRPPGPVCAYAVGSVQRTGARSGSPVQYMFPVAAITPRSEARHAARGPSSPNGVIAHPHRVGRAARIERRWTPGRPPRRVDHDVGGGEQRRRARGRRPRARRTACRRSRPRGDVAGAADRPPAARRARPSRRGRRGCRPAARPGRRRGRRTCTPSSRPLRHRGGPPPKLTLVSA